MNMNSIEGTDLAQFMRGVKVFLLSFVCKDSRILKVS